MSDGGEEMSLIKEFIERSGTAFLNPENTKLNDIVEIQQVSLDSTTFEKSYIVIKGLLSRTNEECNVRLGVQNVKRIADDLGNNETEWIGHGLRVLAYQEYTGLGKNGIIWGGKKKTIDFRLR